MDTSRRSFLTIAATASALALLPVDAAVGATTAAPGVPGALPLEASRRARLTNLAHLRFLLTEVPVAPSDTHTTFGIDTRPTVRAPWTYADTDGAGGFRPVGGGTRDAVTGYWTQGAYNADDIARAAIVFLRDWKASGETQSRDEARDVLRSLAFLQTTTGPNAGRVVLWQQEDGTLNPSAIPVELPDPSDSAESYWLARSVWGVRRRVCRIPARGCRVREVPAHPPAPVPRRPRQGIALASGSVGAQRRPEAPRLADRRRSGCHG